MGNYLVQRLATILPFDKPTAVTFAVGNQECGVGLPSGTTSLTITRQGAAVRVSGTNGASVPCPPPPWSASARLSVGLLAPMTGAAQVTSLSVLRGTSSAP